jgi:hypothetical protein
MGTPPEFPSSPNLPDLPKEPNRNIRVHRRAREAIRDVMKMLKGLSKEQHAELRDVIEAVRKAGYAEGYAAAKMEAALAAAESVESPEAPAAPPPNPKAIQPIMEVGEYISRIPFGTTKAMALDYLKNIKRAAGPTEIIRNTLRQTGTRLTMTTLRRALDALAAEEVIEMVDNSRWRFKEENRPVPLRPIR